MVAKRILGVLLILMAIGGAVIAVKGMMGEKSDSGKMVAGVAVPLVFLVAGLALWQKPGAGK